MTIIVNGKHVTWNKFVALAPTATTVWLFSLPLVTALPDMPVATTVRLESLPLVKR